MRRSSILATRFWGATAGKVLAVFAAISGFGALNGWILLQGELPNVMAKNGVFPPIFARDSARFTPVFALLFSSTLVSILILMNYHKSMVNVFTFMILLSTTACLVLYALCSLALLRLQWTGQMPARRGRVVPLAIVGVIATIFSLWADHRRRPRSGALGLCAVVARCPDLFPGAHRRSSPRMSWWRSMVAVA